MTLSYQIIALFKWLLCFIPCTILALFGYYDSKYGYHDTLRVLVRYPFLTSFINTGIFNDDVDTDKRVEAVINRPCLLPYLHSKFFSEDEWIKLFNSGSVTLHHTGQDILNKEQWITVLCSSSEIWEQFDKSDFTGTDWVTLLEFVPCAVDSCDWSKLNRVDWAKLLQRDLTHLDKASIETWASSEMLSLVKSLEHHGDRLHVTEKIAPFLTDHDVAEIINLDEYLYPRSLSLPAVSCNLLKVLKVNPHLSVHADLSVLQGHQWKELLICHGHLIQQLTLEHKAKLTGSDWAELLLCSLGSIEHCDFSKMSESDWESLRHGELFKCYSTPLRRMWTKTKQFFS